MSKRGRNFRSRGLSPTQIERLRELAAQGLTSLAIANALSTTKGTVMGRVRVLGIRLKQSPGYSPRRKPKTAPKNNNPTGWRGVLTPKPPPLPLRAAKAPLKPKDGNRYAPTLPPMLPSVARVSIDDLAHRQCRYIGERPELLTLETLIYCGAPTDGGSWCPEHRARCIVPLRR
jgi:hypothetical protein